MNRRPEWQFLLSTLLHSFTPPLLTQIYPSLQRIELQVIAITVKGIMKVFFRASPLLHSDEAYLVVAFPRKA